MDQLGLHDLTPEEVRVLGCLIEKESTVPDSYPLTLNSLRTACNQSTSRDPVVEYGDHEIERALASLRERGLTRTVHSTSNRATKYRHVVPEALGLDPAATAVLCVLMLRGPQTVGELKSRCDRQHSFGSTDEVTSVLERLAHREPALALHLERQPGQKDARWVHLLAPVGTDTPSNGDAGATAAVPVAADDPYATTAEFYDLLATHGWEQAGLQLLEILEGVDPANGPIVDVGVGTGVGLPYLVVAVPGAAIHAIEPSRSMRTALHARLTVDPSLREITTVDPRPLSEASLPASACALVASAVLGHFSDDERRLLWRFVAERLPVGAPAVIEVLDPPRPIDVPRNRYAEVRVGAYTYEGWQEAEPVDDRHMRWTMTYRVLDGDEVIDERTAVGNWRCLGVDDVRREVAPFGLDLTEADGMVVVRRRA